MPGCWVPRRGAAHKPGPGKEAVRPRVPASKEAKKIFDIFLVSTLVRPFFDPIHCPN